MIFAQRIAHDHAAEAAYELALAIRHCLKQDIIGIFQFRLAILELRRLYESVPNTIWEEEFDVTPGEFVSWQRGKWPEFANNPDVLHDRLLREKARSESQRAMRRRLNAMTRVLCRDFRFKLEE
jgi:hypothetical protein